MEKAEEDDREHDERDKPAGEKQEGPFVACGVGSRVGSRVTCTRAW